MSQSYSSLGAKLIASKQQARLKKASRTRAKRNRLINRDSLDGRLAIAKAYDSMIGAIHADLGGRDRLSAIELALCEAFTSSAIVFGQLNAKILTGTPLDAPLINMHAMTISAMVRCATKLGTGRRTKLVPSLDEWLSRKSREEGEVTESEIIE